jgi:hypothetical protein
VISPDGINAISISLEVEGRQSLFLMLGADGAISRAGTGTVDNDEYDLYIGAGQANLFKQLLYGVTDSLLSQAGVYSDSQPEGLAGKLTLLLRSADGVVSFEYTYGLKSAGPPMEVADFVMVAVDLTQPWYDEQKQRVST